MSEPNRRKFLRLSSAIGLGVLAGCTGGGASSQQTSSTKDTLSTPTKATHSSPSETEQALSIGDSVTYKNIKVTLAKTETLDSYESGKYPEKQITPDQHAVFFGVYWRVKNVGDTQLIYPDGTGMGLEYKGKSVIFTAPGKPPLKVNGKNITVYSRDFDAQKAGVDNGGAFPGTVVEGWKLYQLPVHFNASDLKFIWDTILFDEANNQTRSYKKFVWNPS